MENDKLLFMNKSMSNAAPQSAWNSSNFATEMNSTSLQIPNCFFNPNWENPMDQNDPFESAMSSIVSSPVASNTAGIPGDNVMIRELIGRLGSICNSGEVSPQSYVNSTNVSCYSTPLNSPPKLNLSTMDHQQMRGNLTPFPADPGFAERAARSSCFGGRNLGGFKVDVNSATEKKFSWFSRSSTPENAEFGDSREGSSVSEQIHGGEMSIKGQRNESNPRKRKSAPRGKGKESLASKIASENDEISAKKSKVDDESGGKESEMKKEEANGNQNQKQGKENSKPPEPQKDYIHVRARRGQATDSHSLAERVRREKISERMKFLQDLVPGCNKVTGKAVMLDEIINYVQSLQCQVEFLSMKLATVNPKMDFNMETLLSKDIFHSRGLLSNTLYPVELSASGFPYGYQPQQIPLHNGISNGTETEFPGNPLNNSSLRQNPSMHLPPIDGFSDAAAQVSAFWEDDLQSIVHMGIGQNQPQMKIEM